MKRIILSKSERWKIMKVFCMICGKKKEMQDDKIQWWYERIISTKVREPANNKSHNNVKAGRSCAIKNNS